MKVITGKYKAKKINAPNERITRPTLQRAKETMFNMLPHNLFLENVLDVFSGSGQLGIEALSRGAKFCYFNEKNSKVFNVLKNNLKQIKKDSFHIDKLDYKDFIQKFKGKKINLIFIDPPYPITEQSLEFLLNFISENKILSDKGLIVGQAPNEVKLFDNYQDFAMKKQQKFSKITRIWIYEKR